MTTTNIIRIPQGCSTQRVSHGNSASRIDATSHQDVARAGAVVDPVIAVTAKARYQSPGDADIQTASTRQRSQRSPAVESRDESASLGFLRRDSDEM